MFFFFSLLLRLRITFDSFFAEKNCIPKMMLSTAKVSDVTVHQLEECVKTMIRALCSVSFQLATVTPCSVT